VLGQVLGQMVEWVRVEVLGQVVEWVRALVSVLALVQVLEQALVAVLV